LPSGDAVEVAQSPIIVFVTASSAEEAERIGRLLVESRLAACANILSGVQSIFWWEAKLSAANEWLIVFKTTLDLFPQLETMVRQHHSYTVPEIIGLPIVVGSAAYLDWIRKETFK